MFDRALIHLMALLFRAGLRKVKQQAKTPTGAIMTLAMFGMVLMGIGPSIAMAFFDREVGENSFFHALGLMMPFFLYGMATIGIVSNAGKAFLELKPAELQFVLAGPFTDRQILSYRLLTMAIGWMPMSLLFALLMMPYTSTFIGTCFGVGLSGSFVILLVIAIALATPKVPVAALTAVRVGLVLGLAALMSETLSASLGSDFSAVSQSLGSSQVTAACLIPFRPFANLMYGTVDASMMVNLGMSVLLVLVSLVVCYSLNAGFSELAADGVGRRIRKLERMKGGNAVASNPTRAEPRLAIPILGWWGGAGPIAWQQLTMSMRRLGRLVSIIFVVGMVAAMVAGYVHFSYPNALTRGQRLAAVPVALGAASYLGFLITMSIPLGFAMPPRSLSWFQLIPIRPLPLAAAMVLGSTASWIALRVAIFLPALVLTSFTMMQCVAFLLAGIAIDVMMISAINFVTAVTNLRAHAQGPPDILQGARAILYMIVVMAATLPTILVGTLSTSIVGFATGFSLTACALTAAFSIMMVQPIVWWFSGTMFLGRELPAN
ncbi:MAG: putative ABC exporter domain-containing protein [Rubripirellula sp.]